MVRMAFGSDRRIAFYFKAHVIQMVFAFAFFRAHIIQLNALFAFDTASSHSINSTAGGELSVQNARSILGPILRVFQLRRAMASQVQLPGKASRSIWGSYAPLHHHDHRARDDGTPGPNLLQSARGVCVELPRAVWTLHSYTPVDGQDSTVSGSPVTYHRGVGSVVLKTHASQSRISAEAPILRAKHSHLFANVPPDTKFDKEVAEGCMKCVFNTRNYSKSPMSIRLKGKRCCCACREPDVLLPRQRCRPSSKLVLETHKSTNQT